MSDFRGLSAVSSTLRTLLRDRMELPNGIAVTDLTVTIGTPRAEAGQTGSGVNEPPRVNLFLYHVSQNEFLRNQDPHGHPGAYGNPPLGLDLRYLITAYGATGEDVGAVDESTAQQMLGSAMRVLHDHSIVSETSLTVRPPAGEPILAQSLRGDRQKLRIALEPLSMEDLTKVWTALTIPFRTSAAYSVQTVRIQSRRSRRLPQLVGEPPEAGPRITVAPYRAPSISTLGVRRPEDPPDSHRNAPYARIGDTLVLEGEHFTGIVSVVMGAAPIRVRPASPRRIEVRVPDTSYVHEGTTITLPPELRLHPGVQTVEVTTTGPGLPPGVARSNRAAFMLTPHVKEVSTTPPRALTIAGTRLHSRDLTGEILVGPVLYPAAAYTEASPERVVLTLPDTLPHRAVVVRATEELGTFIPPTDPPAFTVALAGRTATVRLSAVPRDHAELAAGLQTALRAEPSPEFRGARVLWSGSRILLLAGGLSDHVDVTGEDAQQLGLSSGTERSGVLSGVVDLVAGLRTRPGVVRAVRGDVRAVAEIAPGPGPTSAEAAAPVLQAALRVADADFAALMVVATDGQLLVLDPGADTAPDFEPVAGRDGTTVAQLGLRVSHPVRVRVNGAEAVGGAPTVELPL